MSRDVLIEVQRLALSEKHILVAHAQGRARFDKGRVFAHVAIDPEKAFPNLSGLRSVDKGIDPGDVRAEFELVDFRNEGRQAGRVEGGLTQVVGAEIPGIGRAARCANRSLADAAEGEDHTKQEAGDHAQRPRAKEPEPDAEGRKPEQADRRAHPAAARGFALNEQQPGEPEQKEGSEDMIDEQGPDELVLPAHSGPTSV